MKRIRLSKKAIPAILQKKIDVSLVYVCPYCDREFPGKVRRKSATDAVRNLRKKLNLKKLEADARV